MDRGPEVSPPLSDRLQAKAQSQLPQTPRVTNCDSGTGSNQGDLTKPTEKVQPRGENRGFVRDGTRKRGATRSGQLYWTRQIVTRIGNRKSQVSVDGALQVPMSSVLEMSSSNLLFQRRDVRHIGAGNSSMSGGVKLYCLQSQGLQREGIASSTRPPPCDFGSERHPGRDRSPILPQRPLVTPPRS